MKPINSFILFLFITSTSFAQTVPFFKSYNWELNPKYTIESSDKDMIAIKDKVVTSI